MRVWIFTLDCCIDRLFPARERRHLAPLATFAIDNTHHQPFIASQDIDIPIREISEFEEPEPQVVCL